MELASAPLAPVLVLVLRPPARVRVSVQELAPALR
jgi:hypothetical protein